MKRIIKSIILLSVTILIFSCSDEFLNEKLNISGVATSAVIISPEWETDDYQFQCEDAGNADFVIESKPEWLSIETNSEKFVNSIATIHAKANTDSRFSKTGIYIDQMLITSNRKKFAVPLYYINEGNPSAQVSRTFEINYNNYNNQLQISNSGDGVLLWDIVSLPEWLTVNMDQFNEMSLILGKDASASIPFNFDLEKAIQNNILTGLIVLITNDKNNPQIEIQVTTNLGNPDFNIFENPLNFDNSETSKIFRVYNHGDGMVIWRFEELPEWLTVSPANGVVLSYSSADINFTCDRSKLLPGLNSDTIYLKSSDPDKSIITITVTVRVPGISENVRLMEGNIVDLKFNKNTNKLFYVTSQPNKLVVYDLVAKEVTHEIAFSKAPTCLTISEDFTKAMVGHGGMMSVVNLTDYSISKTYDTDYTVYDVEWANDDWFCFTKANNYTDNLFWINTTTDESFQTSSGSHKLGTADLKKIPNQPYIIAGSKNVSPSGIYVFETETKTLKSYTHTTLDKLWFFNEGQFVVTGFSQIMRTSSITSPSGYNLNAPPSIGELIGEAYRYPAWWIDFSPGSHSIWAILSYHANYYFPPVNATIYQFEDNDYKLVKTIRYDNIYQPDAQTAAYEVEARYVFANSGETELSVLRKGKDNNIWTIEFIPIQ